MRAPFDLKRTRVFMGRTGGWGTRGDEEYVTFFSEESNKEPVL